VREAAKALVKRAGKKTPDRRRHAAYEEAGNRFRALYPALKEYFQEAKE
jgi:sugar (pentulose or hexulose) kinase